jgi:hypothetical protein
MPPTLIQNKTNCVQEHQEDDTEVVGGFTGRRSWVVGRKKFCSKSAITQGSLKEDQSLERREDGLNLLVYLCATKQGHKNPQPGSPNGHLEGNNKYKLRLGDYSKVVHSQVR